MPSSTKPSPQHCWLPGSHPGRQPRLGLIGFSTRALAEAAVDLGFAVSAVDAFCDQDTLELAECQMIHRWPHDVIACARTVPCDGWLLAGGMENHGRLVAQLAAQSPVLGPTRQQLATLRSLRFWRLLAESVPGLRLPGTSRSPHGPLSRVCLYKPRRSSGGMYVADASAALASSRLPRGYWQEFIAGRVLGATCLIDASHVRFLGATESLSASQWLGPRPYIYRGSLGPVELTAEHRETLLAMAARVGDLLGYRGYLQADLIEDACGQLWLLELNPRWTAGMEVLHLCARAFAESPLAAHLESCGWGIPSSARPRTASPTAAAKAILYASCDLQLSWKQRQILQTLRERQPWGGTGWWNIADVPPLSNAESLAIEAGQPVLTLRVGLSSRDSAWAQARQTLRDGLAHARDQVTERVFAQARLQEPGMNWYHE